jgi:hypothetical protein
VLLAAGARVHETMFETAVDEVAVVLAAAAERDGVVHDPGLAYTEGRPALVRVRRRGHRYDIDDLGAAVALAGARPGWLNAARRTVAPLGWNVNRRGIVSVPAVAGRDIARLVRGTAEASVAVYAALAELDG